MKQLVSPSEDRPPRIEVSTRCQHIGDQLNHRLTMRGRDALQRVLEPMFGSVLGLERANHLAQVLSMSPRDPFAVALGILRAWPLAGHLTQRQARHLARACTERWAGAVGA